MDEALQRHALFLLRSLKFLPTPYQAEDSNRILLAYFCLAGLALLPASAVSSYDPTASALDALLTPAQRSGFADWIYAQQDNSGAFRGSSSVTIARKQPEISAVPNLILLSLDEEEEFDRLMAFDDEFPDEAPLPNPVSPSISPEPNLIQSYTALLNLGLLSDDFSRLNRAGIIRFVAKCQNDDGSFSLFPGCAELADPRSTYSAFAISSILSDWGGVDIDRGLAFIASCQRPDGGFAGQQGLESQGGTTYCSIASYALASRLPALPHQSATIRWLVGRQTAPAPCGYDTDESDTVEIQASRVTRPVAGFQGRIGKDPDACYSFWCKASLRLLAPSLDLLRPELDQNWLLDCQHPRYGGIAREPGALPDVYHTYLSLAALSLGDSRDVPLHQLDAAWNVASSVAARMRIALARDGRS